MDTPTPAPYTRLIAVLLSILTTVALGVVFLELKVVLVPFVIAALFSIILQPLVRYLRSKRIPAVFALLIVILSLALFGFLFGLVLSSTVKEFLTALPHYQAKLDTLVDQATQTVQRVAQVFGMTANDIELPFNFATISSTARTGFNTIISFLGTAFLIMLFMLFMMMGSGQSEKKVRQAFPPDLADRISKTWLNIGSQVRQYLITKTMISAITGTLTFLVLFFTGVDFPLIWGVMTFLLNFIPNLGSMLAIVFPFLLSLLQFDTLLQPVVALILMGAIQVSMGNVIEPRMMAFSLNLSPLLVLVSLIFWGWLWGFAGMLLAVPLTATIKIILENIETFRPVSVMMSRSNGNSS